MEHILEKIKGIPNLYHVSGCTEEQLKDAQQNLGIKFPKEYVNYVKEYGAISFYGTEWTGLNIEGYLNVVEATKQERELNSDFPQDCFVIENLAIDGCITVIDEKGQVFCVQYNKKELLCENLEEYLDMCIARKNPQ